jgi:alkanesulfonate monooxygenase SsuD/methylene tetrahydromethanopterin reductase-like flavin-dependent oxidoreductase (luciferase family)
MSIHLAVALEGAGWHPAAWREKDAKPTELFTAAYWTQLIQTAERGLLDFVTIEDGLGLQSEAQGQVRGRLDAVLIASRVAPLTKHIGLVPTAVVTHTEPFHIAKAIATLDYVSTGRGGWRAQVSADPAVAKHFGRRDVGATTIEELFDEAADYVEVVRRLWDSWEDDAEIRDAATGRFVDRDKLHYIDFQGKWFSVKGPSIVPRPPQGQPLVTALAHADIPYRFAERSVDLVYVTPTDSEQVRALELDVPHVFGDLVVFLDADRKARLDASAGEAYASDAYVFTGSAGELADLLQDWHAAGLSGFRLRPGTIPFDLDAITTQLVPELQRRRLFRTAYEASTLRGLLGLGRPANRYAASEGV